MSLHEIWEFPRFPKSRSLTVCCKTLTRIACRQGCEKSLWKSLHCDGNDVVREEISCYSPLMWMFYWVGRYKTSSLQWRHNGRDSVSNHQPHDCLLNRLFGRRSKKTRKLRVTGLCAGNSPGTGKFPTQMASNAKNVSIWWRHHDSSVKTAKAWSTVLEVKIRRNEKKVSHSIMKSYNWNICV